MVDLRLDPLPLVVKVLDLGRHRLLPVGQSLDILAQLGALPLRLLEVVVDRRKRITENLLLAPERLELLPLRHGEEVGVGPEFAVLGQVGVREGLACCLAFFELFLWGLAQLDHAAEQDGDEVDDSDEAESSTYASPCP